MENKKCPICLEVMGTETIINKKIICDSKGNMIDKYDNMILDDIETYMMRNHESEGDKYYCSNCEIYTDLDFKEYDAFEEYLVEFITKNFNIEEEEVLKKYKHLRRTK